jgi:hypothetical protein
MAVFAPASGAFNRIGRRELPVHMGLRAPCTRVQQAARPSSHTARGTRNGKQLLWRQISHSHSDRMRQVSTQNCFVRDTFQF